MALKNTYFERKENDECGVMSDENGGFQPIMKGS
jgi:hypothetical protein